jgi:hypothetical protein
VATNGGNGSRASGGSITISLGVGTATSTGTAGVLGDLSLSTGTAIIGDSDALDIGCKYNSFKYASVIGSCGLDRDHLAQHHDDDNIIVCNRGGTAFQ